tara:strand:- start:17388 stop:17654 length:267 start_codon:yes stop_codon:yes gene_type:complete
MVSKQEKTSKRFDNVELEWAISLMEKEFEKKYRNTPEKMAKLIAENFDVNCDSSQISAFFGLVENYELETNKIENYGSSNYITVYESD